MGKRCETRVSFLLFLLNQVQYVHFLSLHIYKVILYYHQILYPTDATIAGSRCCTTRPNLIYLIKSL